MCATNHLRYDPARFKETVERFNRADMARRKKKVAELDAKFQTAPDPDQKRFPGGGSGTRKRGKKKKKKKKLAV